MHTFNTVCNKKKRKKRKTLKRKMNRLTVRGCTDKKKKKKQEKTVDSLSGSKAPMKHTVIQSDEVKMQAFYNLSAQI